MLQPIRALILSWLLLNVWSYTKSFTVWKTAMKRGTRFTCRMNSLFDNSVDISPTLDGKLLKKVIQRGDARTGYPLDKDSVDITWKIFSVDGQLLHSSNQLKTTAFNSSIFNFQIGATPREVILGWEIGVKQMFEGEVARFTIHPDLAFGSNGVPNIVPSNTTIITEIQLLKVFPSVVREYRSVGINESIKDDLLEKVYAGDSPISTEVLKNQKVNETKSADEIKTFDPSVHKLDPTQRVAGTGVDHRWEETARSIEVDVPLPASRDGWSKRDLEVEIKANFISLRLAETKQVVFQGPLYGKVYPTQSMWAILPDSNNFEYTNDDLMLIESNSASTKSSGNSYTPRQKVQFSLEKSHEFQQIWATVLQREYLAANQQHSTGNTLQ